MKNNADNELMLRVRGMLANGVMADLLNDTQGLIDRYGFDGAEDFLHWRLVVLRNLREAKENFGGDDSEF